MQNRNAAVALGTFDGLHTGHMAVIDAACASPGTTPTALLFDRHPLVVLRGQAPPALLTAEDRIALLEQRGVKPVTLRFEDVRDLPPREFVRDVLVGRLGAARVFCGFNYRFGKEGAGDAALLEKLCGEYGASASSVPAVLYGGEPVSSTRIRACLERGDAPGANAMLGRRFGWSFEVVPGDAVGRGMGFPTANQRFPSGFLIPRRGVYASCVTIDGALLPAMTNIGVRPTVDGAHIRSETHVFGFSGDLYGRKLPVSLLRFVRDERKFDSLDALRAQMRQDRAVCESICEEEGICL